MPPMGRLHRALAFLTLLAAAHSLRAEDADWPQFLGPSRDGVYPGSNVASTLGEGGPRAVWKREAGEGFSGPVIARGRLILFHRQGDREVVECLDAETGAEKWSRGHATGYRDAYGAEDDGPRATPAIAAGRVHVLGAEGKILALDLETGGVLWTADARERFGASEGFFGFAASPLVEGGRLLLLLGGRDGAGIVALDPSTGRTLWKATSDEASCSSPVAATIHGTRHAIFFTRSGLKDLDPATGAVRFELPWRARIAASVNAASPLVVGDLVFISASYQTGAVCLRARAEGGGGPPFEKVWSSDEALSNHYATSVHHGGRLYGFDGRAEYGPKLRCVELETGKVLWTKEGLGGGSITRAGDRLLILTVDGELILLPASPRAYEPSARARLLDGPVRAYPALVKGRLYARGARALVCFDLRPAR